MRLFHKKKRHQIDFDEVLLDAFNLPEFDKGRLEGRIELPIARRGVYGVGIFFILVAGVYLFQLFKLQVISGEAYAAQSTNNHLNESIIFAERGVITDRNGEELAWNAESVAGRAFAERVYTNRKGLGQILGYVNYPRKDSSGFYFRTEYVGRGGVEESYNEVLAGHNGAQLIEVDALGNTISEHVVHDPIPGENIELTIDAELSSALYDHIATSAAKVGFRSGAAVIMDVRTGEVVALASYPSFDPEVMTRGADQQALDAYINDDRMPFLNKIVAGNYTPGSIVKPFMALAALAEQIVSPSKTFVSTGRLVIPNPYNPGNVSVFNDWKAHGTVDMRRAIAVSSNVYFFIIGGGYGDQKGLGITKIGEHMARFGFGHATGVKLPGEEDGFVPSPVWKKETFDEDWRLGDTYNTSIGQYAFQVTPLQMVRAYAAIANGGKLMKPLFVKGETPETVDLNIDPADLKVIHEGMRQGVLDGTPRALNRPDIEFAGKTGTAELGTRKEYVNSWVVGFYPYKDPQYAFVLLMEKGPRANLFGASPIFSQFVPWMKAHKPEFMPTSTE